MSATHLYILSGLGTDERIFSRIDWPCETTYLPWLEPQSGEDIQSYAARMAQSIPNSESILLLGVSFGGVIAQEIAQIRPVKQLFLLSSILSSTELPPMLRLFRYLPLYQLSRGSWRIRSLWLWAPRMGIRKPEEIALLKEMFSTFSDRYRMWAIRAISHWNSPPLAIPWSRLHGEKDPVFPIKYIGAHTLIPGANHFMVYQQGEQVSQWICEQLADC